MDEIPPPIPPMWAPLRFFTDWDEFRHMGPLIFGLVGIVVIATLAFLYLTFRRRVERFFSLPLFLALVPFGMCANISLLRFYVIIGSAPPSASMEAYAMNIISIAYPFQFGAVLTSLLVFIHTFVFVLRWKERASQSVL